MKTVGSVLGDWGLRLLGHLPAGFHRRASGFVKWFMQKVLHYRESVMMTNLARSFPEKKYKELSQIADKSYLHIADLITQSIWFYGCQGPRGQKRFSKAGLLECTNPEVLDNLYKQGKSIMLLNSHCGNWELMGGIIDMKGAITIDPKDICVVYRKMKNSAWDAVFERGRSGLVRHRGFNGYIETENVLRYALGRRGIPTLYILNNDQHPFNKIAKSYDVGIFLNQRTEAMGGALAIARKLSMPVVFIHWDSSERWHYQITFETIAPDASKVEIEQLLRAYYDRLEENIKEQPYNYLWTHKRWK